MNNVGKIAGVDEVGRGCWAGSVMVCALILKNDSLNDELKDSKALSQKKREYLFDKIIEIADYKIISYDAPMIDRVNILQATLLGMADALKQLNPDYALIDGHIKPKTDIPCQAIIRGDGLIPVISAASIIAKVTRDAYMRDMSKIYPEYGFENHKGYGTKQHLLALEQYGVTPIHRLSFAPVKKIYQKAQDSK